MLNAHGYFAHISMKVRTSHTASKEVSICHSKNRCFGVRLHVYWYTVTLLYYFNMQIRYAGLVQTRTICIVFLTCPRHGITL
jgi:hypothetical protein